MTNYIIDRKKLKEILLMHKNFVSAKAKKLVEQGVDITKLTYRDTEKLTDEFIDTMINGLPLDDLLDQVDVVMKSTVGYTSKDALRYKDDKSST